MQVENFFTVDKKCHKVGSAISSPLMLRVFGGSIYPDVYGVSDPTKTSFQIYMAEGKRSFRGRSFDECKGQAMSLQRFADCVYMFFPRTSWNELDEKEKSDVEEECVKLKLGLLIVDRDSCQEKVKAYPNPELLKEENRILAKDKIVQYFPNFLGPEECVSFFGEYSKLADSIIKECCSLIDEYLVETFRKITHIKKQSIKPWYSGDTFEFYMISKLRKSEVLLIMKPFGSEDFETTSPVLLIQERFKSSIINENDIRQKVQKYIDECLKAKCKVITSDYIYDSTDTSERILGDISNSSLEDFSIFEQIEILGVEKEKIKKEVEKSLRRIVDFSNSLRRSR